MGRPCHNCHEPIRSGWAVHDFRKTLVGLYCSRNCAEEDAYGPSRFTVEPASSDALMDYDTLPYARQEVR